MLLTIHDVTKKYGKHCALQNVSLELSKGVYGLLGANGAGKTTLINIIMTILTANEGKILLDGTDIRKLGTQYLNLLGYMPQYPRFYPNFRVDEFLEYMCGVKDVPKKQIGEVIENVLIQTNLKEHQKKRIRELSGGMRQRVGIAQAILNDPQILVLDEPTAGLDPAERIRFRNIISKISKNRIVLIATHIVQDIEYIANEVIILKAGALVQKGTIEELCTLQENRVWSGVLSEEQLRFAMDHYLISNMRQEGTCTWVRLVGDEVSEKLPVESTPPHLEDVFLDLFEEGDFI